MSEQDMKVRIAVARKLLGKRIGRVAEDEYKYEYGDEYEYKYDLWVVVTGLPAAQVTITFENPEQTIQMALLGIRGTASDTAAETVTGMAWRIIGLSARDTRSLLWDLPDKVQGRIEELRKGLAEAGSPEDLSVLVADVGTTFLLEPVLAPATELIHVAEVIAIIVSVPIGAHVLAAGALKAIMHDETSSTLAEIIDHPLITPLTARCDTRVSREAAGPPNPTWRERPPEANPEPPSQVSYRAYPDDTAPTKSFPSPPIVYDDLIRRFFVEEVQPGRLLFNPPGQMRLGETERVEVRLTRTLELDDELRKNLRGHGEPQLEEIDTAPLMAVKLKGNGFLIAAHSDEEQSVSQDRPTTWEFDIRAVERGHQRLVLSVSLRIPVPGLPAERRSIPVREVTIDVQVGKAALVGHFVSGNWRWLVGTAIAVAAVVVAVVFH